MDTPQSLAADMLKAASKAPVVTTAVVSKGALNVKNDARRGVAVSAPIRNAHAQYAIGYDISVNGGSIEAEIGYDKDVTGGALGNLLEFGGGGDHSPPHRDLGRALDTEESVFEVELGKAIEKLL